MCKPSFPDLAQAESIGTNDGKNYVTVSAITQRHAIAYGALCDRAARRSRTLRTVLTEAPARRAALRRERSASSAA
ncbi:MAG: hypothetical protein AAGL17_08310, partial [Cyanobacteria bacterium J06576_12]